MTKRIEGPTPCGGSYATITYLDENNNVVDESVATKAIGCEFNENDKLLQETFLVLEKNKNESENV